MYFRSILYSLTAVLACAEAVSRAERPRRGRGADTAELLSEIRDLKESQEVLHGEVAHLRRSLENLQDIVSFSLPEDCSAAEARGGWTSTAFVKPPGLSPRMVKCDQKELGGGWTVILSRQPTHRVNFNATWQQYKDGFGDINSEFWIGNEVLHALTKEVPHQLHAIMTDWGGNTRTSTWNYFTVGSEADRYRLGINDYQKSNNGAEGEDALRHHNNHTFSTHDNDNDADPADHCAQRHGGGWWYFRCYTANPTGVALDRNEKGHHGMTWRTRDRELSLISITMMIRPSRPES